ncbi:ABC transporter substrate-binding protein [Verminephrobacter eiseniae]|uniref:ABC transporter substrate-binding protein n=1 Tax=Verminephrobacter eiseniae TaxID=364317 RepID=UPI0022389F4B|nr:ABC transporter substrate-binding protein [Verminephrobacter eiseniae]MCW5238804.1 ABC transporter substrate-binding protein [Verminephrobacter eiseniae]
MPPSTSLPRLTAPAVFLLLAAMSAMGVMGATATHAPAHIVVAQPADIRSTNPGVNRDNTTDGVLLNMLEGLVGYHENGSVGPLLAKAIDVSADGLTYTFTLRTGVKFHNGEHMTSADVLWSWNRYMNPKTDWRCLNDFDGHAGTRVVSASAPDAQTFVLQIDKPSAIFLDNLARTDCAMAAVISKKSVKEDGSWDKPIGTGPYKLDEWKRGEYVAMSAFADYQSPPGNKPDGYLGLKKPQIAQVKFLVVPDLSAAKAGLQSGAIDAGQITSSDVKELRVHRHLRVIVPGEASKNTLLMQTHDPVLKDERIRLAIALSLDMRQIVEAASEGLAQVNNSAIHGKSLFYGAQQKKGYPHDPAKARLLLQQAGYRGQPIVIQANKRAHVPSYTVAVLSQAMMQAAGINAQIEVLEWATQLDRYNSGNYQMSSFTYSSRLDPALSYEQFSGSKAVQPRKVWDDPDAQRLIVQSFVEADSKKRQALFDQLHAMMMRQTPLIVLYNTTGAWAIRKRVNGYTVWEGKPLMWTASVKD